MATRGIAHDVKFIAWDTTNNVGKTGDAANITMRWIKSTTSAALTTTTVTEVDSTNCPGVYRVALSATETDTDIGTLAGKSSTANISIIPVTIQFERLPDAAPTAAGGVLDTTRINGVSTTSVTTVNANIGTTQPVNFSGTGASALAKSDLNSILGTALTETAGQIAAAFKKFFNVATPTGTVNSIPDAVAGATGGIAIVGSNMGSVASVTAGVTVTTNNDKTGYGLASTGLDSIATTAPAGVASNFREMLVAVWRRYYKKATMTSTQIKTYADDGTTVITTQTVSDDGTTQTVGASS